MPHLAMSSELDWHLHIFFAMHVQLPNLSTEVNLHLHPYLLFQQLQVSEFPSESQFNWQPHLVEQHLLM